MVPGFGPNTQQCEGSGDGLEEAKAPGGDALCWRSWDALSPNALLSLPTPSILKFSRAIFIRSHLLLTPWEDLLSYQRK